MDIKQFILNNNNTDFRYYLFECSRKNIKNNNYIISSNNLSQLIELIRSINNNDKHYLIHFTGCSYIEEYNENGYFLKNHDKTFFLV